MCLCLLVYVGEFHTDFSKDNANVLERLGQIILASTA